MAPPPTAQQKRKAADVGNSNVKRLKSNYNKVITVIVGKDQTSFIVHQDMICQRSAFFRKACSADWQNPEENTVDLPDAKPFEFRVYIQGLCEELTDLVGLVKVELKQMATKDQRERTIEGKVVTKLCKLWVLGDYLGDNNSKTMVMNSLGKCYEGQFQITPKTIDLAFGSTDRVSGLQKFMVDFTKYTCAAEGLDELWDQLPDGYKRALLKKLVEANQKTRPKKLIVAEYYEEGES